MSESKQAPTPGPWTADRRGTHGVSNYTVIGMPANWHCEIARVYHGDRFANGEANARLIAAAPDLFAALEAMIDVYREDNDDEHQPAVVLKALAALSKARGEGGK